MILFGIFGKNYTCKVFKIYFRKYTSGIYSFTHTNLSFLDRYWAEQWIVYNDVYYFVVSENKTFYMGKND